jgi:FkbM family methyltransferase
LNVIDAGARTDVFLAELFQKNKSSKILLIEPNPNFCKVLKKKISSLNLNNVKVLQIALGDHEGELTYYKHSQSLILRNVYGKKYDSKTLGSSVTLTTLDKVIQSENIGYPVFIKTDLEMYDYFALNGGKSAINQTAIAVQFELGLETLSVNEPRKIQDFIELFQGDWQFFILHDKNNEYLTQINPKMAPLIRLIPDAFVAIEMMSSKGVTFNIVALHPDWVSKLNELSDLN